MPANRSGSYSGGLVDPSNLHLKKELTQIRKAARTLRDRGTTSSWRSPLSSSRSTTAVAIAASITTTPSNHYNHHYSYSVEENNVNEISNNVSGSSNNHNTSRRKEKKVFLYNWKTQRSESERSASVENTRRLNLNGDGDDSLSDARNDRDLNNVDNRYALSSSSKMFSNCKGATSLMKKKPHSSSSALKLGQQRHLILPDQYDEVNSDDMVIKSSKLLRGGSRKDDSSYCYSTTPALSTSSFSKYWIRNPSTVGSWDAGSLNYDDDDDDDLQGCGIPCYWSSSKRSTPKRGGVCGSCYSPSFSDTSRRKGTSMLKKRHVKKSSQSQGLVPLLTNGAESRDPSSIGTDDELSTNNGELDLEASSRLDGRRWSTSQHGLELVAVEEGDGDSPSSLDNINCFSHKYKPLFFEDLVGQNVVVQSLVTAITRSRIAPIYLFQGPRGTGKTSTARVFAAALNCLATGDPKPCGICRECADFILGKRHVITEMDGSNKKGIDKVRSLIKKLNLGIRVGFTRHEVYVIDECHLLPSKLWVTFQKFLEEPPPSVVFIFITTDLDNVPRAVLSRCQKYIFGKIKESEIVNKLRKISVDENLDVEKDALDLIASNVQGSLRDAETMLDQLSLLGNKITTDLVNELIGVVSDDQLLELLELAMSSNTAETVKRAREVMELGVDPMVVMSQMATLIMDIIAGTYQVVDGRSLTESEIERLKHALKLLCESEKQLRLSSERSTWFTATLLQLGLADPTPSGSSRRQSSRSQNSTSPQDALLSIMNGDDDDVTNSNILDDIWSRCIDKCHSKTLRHLLHTYGKLVSMSEDKGIMVASIVFGNKDIKSRAERFVSSITNSFEIVLHRNIQVRIGVEEPGPKPGNPVQRIESIIREQRLETAWLQTAEKGGTPGLLKPEAERNQVLPRDQMEEGMDEEKWKDNVLKMNDGNGISKDHIGRHYSMSPSFLHDSNLAAKGYESGSGGRGCFCFNNRRKRRGKMKVGTPVGPRRGARFSLFGECGKAGRSRR